MTPTFCTSYSRANWELQFSSQGTSSAQATTNCSAIGSNTENCPLYSFHYTNVDIHMETHLQESAGSVEATCSQFAF